MSERTTSSLRTYLNASKRLVFIGLLPLVASVITACLEPEGRAVELVMVPTLAGHPLQCERPLQLESGRTWRMSTLLFFAHNLRLVDAQGQEQPLRLEPDERWQQENLALLDFENAQESCENGSTLLNTSLRGHVIPGRYEQLRATLGVPFELNHSDPMQAQAPLTETTMHWGWQGGYKFFRLDGRLDAHPVVIHLGSTGCRGKIGNIEGCDRPNRPELHFGPFVLDVPAAPADMPVQVKVPWALDGLLASLEAASGEHGKWGCMGTVEEPGCLSVYRFFQLDLQHGTPLTRTKSVEEGRP
ncbi:MAG: MbnP family copper-binding protein [Myxococcota bacterium]